MTTNMITAARLLGHKAINGKYQSTLKLDEFPVIGHQMVSFFFFFLTCLGPLVLHGFREMHADIL